MNGRIVLTSSITANGSQLCICVTPEDKTVSFPDPYTVGHWIFSVQQQLKLDVITAVRGTGGASERCAHLEIRKKMDIQIRVQ